jgi:DNA-binding response OmpR family regulator
MSSDERVTVAIVEDEPDLREAVVTYLGLHGFEALAFESAEAFRADPHAGRARIAILDVAMPGENGLSLARSISRQRHAGIIMATANGANTARAIGLESGADDYLVKPYELRELLARIRALLRRLPEPSPSAAPSSQAFTFGDVAIDFAARIATRKGEPLVLTEAEFSLLRHLTDRPGRAVSIASVSEALGHEETSERAIRTAISKLRAKIEPDPGEPRHIHTTDGGYRFEL